MHPGKNILRMVFCGFLFLCLAECSAAAKQMAVIVNQGNSLQGLTAGEMGKIFKCDTRKWTSGGAITIVVRDPSTPEMELLLSRIYKTTPEDLRIFMAAHLDAFVVVDSNEVMLSAVHTIPVAIGLIYVVRLYQEVK